MTRLLGYARVSTTEQNLDLQRDALDRAGCERIFADTASGALDDRPQLAKAIAALRAGDVLVVWRLDRLGRSLRHLIETVNDLRDRGIGVPQPAGVHRHLDIGRKAGLPHFRGLGRVRAGAGS